MPKDTVIEDKITTSTCSQPQMAKGGAPLLPYLGADTMIDTPNGSIRACELRAGDKVCTVTNGDQSIRWIGTGTFQSGAHPVRPGQRMVRIQKGTLSEHLPANDLLVSEHQHVLVCSRIIQRMFHRPEVLVAASALCCLPGIFLEQNRTDTGYVHIFLGRQELIFAQGVPCNTLLAGQEVFQRLKSPERAKNVAYNTGAEEIRPTKHNATTVCPIPEYTAQLALVIRHMKNTKPLLPILSK